MYVSFLSCAIPYPLNPKLGFVAVSSSPGSMILDRNRLEIVRNPTSRVCRSLDCKALDFQQSLHCLHFKWTQTPLFPPRKGYIVLLRD